MIIGVEATSAFFKTVVNRLLENITNTPFGNPAAINTV